MALLTTDLDGKLPKVASGKVRELFALPGDRLLFVATDRISAYDVILNNGIPDKGKVLTQISLFWFDYLKDVARNHLAADQSLPSEISSSPELSAELAGRSLVVQKYKILPLEVIVRGYITGSAWAEYQKHGTAHGIKLPEGLQESQALPEPLYTPSTKAEQGEHDENISPERAAEIVGADLGAKVEKLALALYKEAHSYALKRGIIIADTKFEFGVDENNNLVLVDEVLTPDSSRFWPKDTYKVGTTPDSYDKQFVRNWLTAEGLRGEPNVSIPDEIAAKTADKYRDVLLQLTGKKVV